MNNDIEIDIINTTDNNSNNCSICLIELNNPDDIIKLNCSHTYHNNCIKLWFNKNQTCPLCRSKIIIPSLEVNLPDLIEIKDHSLNCILSFGCCILLLLIIFFTVLTVKFS